MKRRIVVTFLLLMFGCMLMSDSNFGLGIDFPGTHELSNGGDEISYDSNMGIEVFSEFYTQMSKSLNFEGGFGVAYTSSRGIDFTDFEGAATVSYLPVYLMLMGQLISSGQDGYSLFGKVRYGYDLMFGNDDYPGDLDLNGGLFMGFGGWS